MNLGEFHDLVSSTCARGTSLDSLIPAWTRQAALFLERNYTFKYMERFGEITLNPDADYPRAVSFPSLRVKRFRFMRVLDADSKFQEIEQIDPEELLSIKEGRPNAFWLDGVNYIYFDRTPDDSYTVEVGWDELSAWPTADAAEHWLIDTAEDLLLAQAMLKASGYTRNQAQAAFWTAEREVALQAALAADAALREGARNYSMNYTEAFR